MSKQNSDTPSPLELAAKIIQGMERERRGLIAQNMVYAAALNRIAGNPAEVAREPAMAIARSALATAAGLMTPAQLDALIATAGEPLGWKTWAMRLPDE